MLTILQTKLISLVVVTVGSFICGTIPAYLGFGSRCKTSPILSFVLCFGGGVLFATSVVHILPDVRSDLPKWCELVFCLGFFFIYFIDVLTSYFAGDHHQTSNSEDNLIIESRRTYGSVDEGVEPTVDFSHNSLNETNREYKKWNCMSFGLLVAFSVHALLEGLVIGIQDSPNGVLLLLGAVCSHKLLVAFCLGAELVADGRPWQYLICPLLIFILGSDLGIILGMIFQVDETPGMQTAVPVMEGLAGGTLLYIALCEIIPREKARKLPAYASFYQFIAIFFGFSLMSALSILI